MIPLDPPLRPARVEDAPVLARLVNEAGEGLPLHLWTGMAEGAEDPWEIGRRRQAGKVQTDTIVVVDEGGGAVAGLTGYAVGAEPEALDGLPPLFRPMQELENLALRTWYVNVLATLPEARGRGLGTRLLGVAEAIARDAGLGRMSVIVFDTNAGARRLYERLGYAERARRPIVRNGWQTDGQEYLLLVKDI